MADAVRLFLLCEPDRASAGAAQAPCRCRSRAETLRLAPGGSRPRQRRETLLPPSLR
jgi:hypothetical protein